MESRAHKYFENLRGRILTQGYLVLRRLCLLPQVETRGMARSPRRRHWQITRLDLQRQCRICPHWWTVEGTEDDGTVPTRETSAEGGSWR
ncbi:hypothetical protein M408DRAFT_179791 [Serendipita vermifera MAFF 305830]|uniref:Uncharacterized protein n=1 Tax=Serendipita vermifera MAFF 305830 TaxID=933852 RepID=A0A0C3B5H3_SERVB|nr:hypothetical protein M408DRAFT_179791 [Serendipita vermifera MAFF 305830]